MHKQVRSQPPELLSSGGCSFTRNSILTVHKPVSTLIKMALLPPAQLFYL